mgnify:CR=1 FL=1
MERAMSPVFRDQFEMFESVLAVDHGEKTYAYLCNVYRSVQTVKQRQTGVDIFSIFATILRTSERSLGDFYNELDVLWAYFREDFFYVAVSSNVDVETRKRKNRLYDRALEIRNFRSTAAALKLYGVDPTNEVLKIEKTPDIPHIKLSFIYKTVSSILL